MSKYSVKNKVRKEENNVLNVMPVGTASICISVVVLIGPFRVSLKQELGIIGRK